MKNGQPPIADIELAVAIPEQNVLTDNGNQKQTQRPEGSDSDSNQFPNLSQTRAILLVAVVSIAAVLTVRNISLKANKN